MKPLILSGGGGHCRSVIEVAKAAGRDVKGVLEPRRSANGEVLGMPILGSDEDACGFRDAEFLITVGSIESTAIRRKVSGVLDRTGVDYATLIAPTAVVSQFAEIGEGCVVMHHSLVNAGAKVGRHCIINSGAIVEHDSQVGDFCHISTGAIVNGGCTIGDDCFIGSHATVMQGVEIPAGTVIGAGAVVHRSLKEPGVYAGYPARKI